MEIDGVMETEEPTLDTNNIDVDNDITDMSNHDMATESTDHTNLWCLKVTSQQEDTVRHLFSYYDWNIEEVPLNRETVPDIIVNDSVENVEEDEPFIPGYVIEQDPLESKCHYCLCSPCITDERNRQDWWQTEPVAAHIRNSGLRKIPYRKFWTMLHHREIWIDPEYMARKVAARGYDPTRKQFVYHRRDIMPKCVLLFVRGWFPNTANVPYIGHMWE